jgi:hypothetical protein
LLFSVLSGHQIGHQLGSGRRLNAAQDGGFHDHATVPGTVVMSIDVTVLGPACIERDRPHGDE